MNQIYLVLAGAIGAFIKDILEDNTLVLPKKIDGKWSLGFLGGICIGGFVGYVADQNPLTALLAGFAGMSAIKNLLYKKPACKVV